MKKDNQSQKITGGYRWWQFRQKLARFCWKASLIMLFLSGISWLNGEMQTCILFFSIAKYLIVAMVLIIISQSFDIHGAVIEPEDFQEDKEII